MSLHYSWLGLKFPCHCLIWSIAHKISSNNNNLVYHAAIHYAVSNLPVSVISSTIVQQYLVDIFHSIEV